MGRSGSFSELSFDDSEEWQVALVLLEANWRGPLQDAALHLGSGERSF